MLYRAIVMVTCALLWVEDGTLRYRRSTRFADL
jgi:hypothetical protein